MDGSLMQGTIIFFLIGFLGKIFIGCFCAQQKNENHRHRNTYNSSNLPLRLAGLHLVRPRHLGAALPAGCSLLFYGTETQPEFTIAAGCPGRDLVRLWPLPIQMEWDEDWWDPVDGLIL